MGHYLKANKTSRTPSTFIFFDTETRPDEIPGRTDRVIHRFRLGCASSFRWEGGIMTRRKQLDFEDIPYFWNWVVWHLSKQRPVWMFAHNVGFDLTVSRIWELVEDGPFKIKRYVSDDPPVILSLEHERGKLVILDSLNWFRCSLETIGKDMGLDKIPVDFTDCTDGELMDHCRRDVEILERRIFSLLTFLRENDLGVMQKTAPAQALQCYRHRFAPRTTVTRIRKCKDGEYRPAKVEVCYPLMHDNKDLAGRERRAYFGGEARCFWIGRVFDPESVQTVGKVGRKGLGPREREGPIYHLDVNSLYPYVMKEYKYPCKYLHTLDSPSQSDLRELLKTHEAIAVVKLNSPTTTFPIRILTKPAYVCGHFWTVLTGNELRHALNCCFVTSIQEAYMYEVRDMFTGFVASLWNKRKEYQAVADKSSESLCKLLLNSLQGKFGAKAHQWIDRSTAVAPIAWGRYCFEEPWGGHVTQYRSIGWHVQEKQEGGEARDSFVSIPAAICSNGRDYMRRLREVAGQGNTLYQHTDSMHVTREGYDILLRNGYIDQHSLGKLKLVEVMRYGEYRGINNYSINGRDIVSGLKGDSKPIEERVYRTTQFASLARIVAAKPPDGILVRTGRFEIPTGDTSGAVSAGGTVYPLRMG